MKPTWQTSDGTIQLYLGDCLEVLPTLGKVDAVVTDPPYGTTRCSWDVPVPLADWWGLLGGLPAVVFASQPFTTELIQSNRKAFKYTLVWHKSVPTGHLNANKMPLRAHEDIVVFGGVGAKYNAQMWQGEPNHGYRTTRPAQHKTYGDVSFRPPCDLSGEKHPRSVLFCATERGEHSTTKPVPLLESLIKSYSDEGDTILDTFMGSGTTGVACARTGRGFVGIEIDPKFFNIAVNRIEAELNRMPLFEPPKAVQQNIFP